MLAGLSAIYAMTLNKKYSKKGGEPAFPVNVSLNDIAAHYTAVPNDPITVKNSDVLKIDIGVHIDGYIADNGSDSES